MKRVLFLTLLAALLAGCGVKNDLIKPNGEQTPKNTTDPSRPPFPLGR
jgi:predicted small lipoprotein YifL